MGFYWTTVVYFGRLLSKETAATFRASDAFDPKCLTDFGDDQGRCFMHPPGAFVTVASMNPILDNKDKTEGLTYAELVHAARACPGLLDPIDKVKENVSESFIAKLSAISPPNKDSTPAVYICEFMSDTYGPGIHITYNLRVNMC